MTCVECGAEMGTSHVCQRCGAPAVLLPASRPPGLQTVGQEATRSTAWVKGFLVATANACAIFLGYAFMLLYVTQGTSGAYIPLWVVLLETIICGIVPAITVVYWVRRLRRRAREGRALASDAPVLLPETLD